MILSTKEYIKSHVVSFAQTFISTFLVTLSAIVTQVPYETLSDPTAWSKGAITACIFSLARTALKIAWEKTLPVSVGGLPKK